MDIGTSINARRERIFVIIPMYRVEPYIQKVIAEIPEWVEKIVAVDDASPDHSGERALATGDPRVVLVSLEKNQGVGGAMLAGYAKAVELGATIMVKIDGDGQMGMEYLPKLVSPIFLGKADYSKGNRFVMYESLLQMPWQRRFGNLCLSFMAKIASGYWNIFDPTNGYTAITRDAFCRLNQTHIHRRYFFETSLLIELNLQRAVIADVSMPARYLQETSSLSISRTIREFPHLLLQGLSRRIWLQYFVMDFSLGSLYLVLGALMMLGGFIWGIVKWVDSIQTGIPATTGTVMLAAMPFILGFQLVLSAIGFDMQNVPRIPISGNSTNDDKWKAI